MPLKNRAPIENYRMDPLPRRSSCESLLLTLLVGVFRPTDGKEPIATGLGPSVLRTTEAVGAEVRVILMEELLSAQEAAKRLGTSVGNFYDWLGQSDAGTLVIRGQPATIDYLQGGPKGQGRIRIEAEEVRRLLDLMRVRPQRRLPRRLPVKQEVYPGITVKLGRPDV